MIHNTQEKMAKKVHPDLKEDKVNPVDLETQDSKEIEFVKLKNSNRTS